MGLSRVSEEEWKKLEEYLQTVKKDFAKVKGVTPLVRHEIKLTPSTIVKELRQFFDFLSRYRRFVKNTT